MALLVATLPAAHAQLDRNEKVEFGAALYEIRGHLDALEINLGAAPGTFTPAQFMADPSRASFHAMHPIGEVYPAITGDLSAIDPSVDASLRSALEALQARVDAGAATLADIAPEMRAAREATDAAQRATVGAVPSGDAALDAAIAAELLGVVGDEYDAAIVGGEVELIVELQDAYAFLDVASRDLYRGQGHSAYPQSQRAAIDSGFDGIYRIFAERGDTGRAMEMTSSLAGTLVSAVGSGPMMMEDDDSMMMDDSTMMMMEDDDSMMMDGDDSRFAASAGRITTIIGLLEEAKAEHGAGNVAGAREIVQNAYLYEFEFVERDLDDAGEPDLRASIESTLNEHLLLALRANSPEVPSMIDDVTAELVVARASLQSPGTMGAGEDNMAGLNIGSDHLTMDERVEFGAALYEIRGHLDALEINLGASPAMFTAESFMADTSRASFHAMHPIGEVYPAITGSLRVVDTGVDDTLRNALEALQTRVDAGAASTAEIAPEMAAARQATDAAQRATVGAVPSGDAALDAAIAAELLGVVGDEYDAAIVNGEVELIVELQDAYAFLNVAHMDLFRGSTFMEYSESQRSEFEEDFGEIYAVFDNRGDPARLTGMTAALAGRLGSAFDGSMDRTMPASEPAPAGGGCLIATAAYGTEMAGEIQALREVRDSVLLGTGSGSAFMSAFNSVYYSFSPTVADWERESPELRAAIRAMITPMVASLSIMSAAEPGSELDVAALGALVIALNVGLYVAAPAALVWRLRR